MFVFFCLLSGGTVRICAGRAKSEQKSKYHHVFRGEVLGKQTDKVMKNGNCQVGKS